MDLLLTMNQRARGNIIYKELHRIIQRWFSSRPVNSLGHQGAEELSERDPMSSEFF